MRVQEKRNIVLPKWGTVTFILPMRVGIKSQEAHITNSDSWLFRSNRSSFGSAEWKSGPLESEVF